MERSYYVIDAFAGEPFAGNPAAVVLDALGLDDRRMQAIAEEFNLSETTFVLPPTNVGPVCNRLETGPTQAHENTQEGANAGLRPPRESDATVRFRWFTPTAEVDMCGHATIAGVHALVESGRLQFPKTAEKATVSIDTRSGTLTAFVERIPESEQWMIWLDLIDPTLTPQAMEESNLASVLSLGVESFESSLPMVKTQDDDLLVFVKDFQLLNEARPDFKRLGRLLERNRLRGLSLATAKTLTPSINLQSRFFAPNVGVNEDPVTGSVHGPLAAYMVKHGLVPVHDGIAALSCTQAKAGGRAGLVYVLVQPKGNDVYAVRIGGRAVTTMRGTLNI